MPLGAWANDLIHVTGDGQQQEWLGNQFFFSDKVIAPDQLSKVWQAWLNRYVSIPQAAVMCGEVAQIAERASLGAIHTVDGAPADRPSCARGN